MKAMVPVLCFVSLLVGTSLASRLPVLNAFEKDIHEYDYGLPRTSLKDAHLLVKAELDRHEPVQRRKGGEDESAYVAIKFEVPPSASDNFVKAWLQLEEAVDREERDAVDLFVLHKTSHDNLIYYSYGEWSSRKDLLEHLRSEWFRDFAERVDEEEVQWELEILKNLSAELERQERGRHQGGRKEGGSGGSGKRSGSQDRAHRLFRFHVPPGEAESFIDAWRDTAQRVIKEDGNRVFTLRKLGFDNVHFYSYGSWDSREDFRRHYESQHVASLVDFAEEKDILWQIIPLEKLGDSDE